MPHQEALARKTLHLKGEVFGYRSGGSIVLNSIGRIVQATWMSIPEHYAHVHLDAFVVMPDHIHGIIVFTRYPRNNQGWLVRRASIGYTPRQFWLTH